MYQKCWTLLEGQRTSIDHLLEGQRTSIDHRSIQSIVPYCHKLLEKLKSLGRVNVLRAFKKICTVRPLKIPCWPNTHFTDTAFWSLSKSFHPNKKTAEKEKGKRKKNGTSRHVTRNMQTSSTHGIDPTGAIASPMFSPLEGS